MANCIAIVNQKGGVGKTTTVVNLAACAALEQHRTLLVDTDPQGNATSGLGVDRNSLQACIYDLLVDDEFQEDPETALDLVITPSSVPNLDVIPATINLAGADLSLANAIARDMRLKRILEPARKRYDLILIDTAPSLGVLTINGLAAAQEIIVPMQCEYYALEGLTQLLKVINLVRGQLNPALSVRGVILTMYDARANLTDEVADEIRRYFPGKVYSKSIPRNVRLAEAPSHGLPAVVYDPSCRGSKAFWDLYREVFPRA